MTSLTSQTLEDDCSLRALPRGVQLWMDAFFISISRIKPTNSRAASSGLRLLQKACKRRLMLPILFMIYGISIEHLPFPTRLYLFATRRSISGPFIPLSLVYIVTSLVAVSRFLQGSFHQPSNADEYLLLVQLLSLKRLDKEIQKCYKY